MLLPTEEKRKPKSFRRRKIDKSLLSVQDTLIYRMTLQPRDTVGSAGTLYMDDSVLPSLQIIMLYRQICVSGIRRSTKVIQRTYKEHVHVVFEGRVYYDFLVAMFTKTILGSVIAHRGEGVKVCDTRVVEEAKWGEGDNKTIPSS